MTTTQCKTSLRGSLRSSLKGLPLDDPRIETPVFVINDEKLEANLQFAKDRAAALGVTLRPHLKTHKAWKIAKRQMISPEGPATVSSLAEARYFAAKGVKDIIYAVGLAPQKLAAVSEIRRSGCDLKVLLDSVEAASEVAAYCERTGEVIPVLIEIDVDGHRSGLKPGDATILSVAEALRTKETSAELAGVLTHAGGSYDAKSIDEIRLAAQRERDGIVEAAEMLRREGYQVPIVSIGSTPTLTFAEDETGVTEIRAGVYALLDLFMANLGVAPIDRIAGSVLCTVIGHQKEKGQVIVDAGFLAMSRDRGTQRQQKDYGFGLICDLDGTPFMGGRVYMKGTNQEHGILEAMTGEPLRPEDFPIGMRLRVLPNHACPTAAPYRTLLLVGKDGRITDEIFHVRGWDYCPAEDAAIDGLDEKNNAD